MDQLKEYQKLYSKISNIVNEHDPINLGGVPEEYDNQVNEIIKLIKSKKDYKFTADDLYQIFAKSFSDSMTEDKSSFAAIANAIRKLD
jgi:hypothetical protein